MQAGTVVLLARMKDRPEEFFGAGSHRWDRIITDAMPYLPTEDKAAIDSALSELHVNRFNERVFKHLAGEEASLFGPSAYGSVPTDDEQFSESITESVKQHKIMLDNQYRQSQQNSGWGSALPGQAITQGGWGPKIKSPT
jgi:hypothetical protein